MKSVIGVLLLALVAGQASSAAQAPTSQTTIGSIAGRVIDPDGGVVPGVTVMVSSPLLPAARSLVTNARGEFAIADLAPGTYELRLSLTGFKTARGEVTVLPGRRSSTGFSLQLGSLSETVTISGIASGAQPPAVAAPGAVAGAPQVPIRVGGDIQEPRKLKDVAPAYPATALAAGISGMVIIEAVISRDGTVANARVIQGVPELDGAALAAVRQWLYRPTMLNGQPVAVVVNVTMTFVVR